MPKILCKCGYLFRLESLVAPEEWQAIAARDFGELAEKAGKHEMFPTLVSLLKCPRCHRLWVHWTGFNDAAQEYLESEVAASRDHEFEAQGERELDTRAPLRSGRWLLISSPDFEALPDGFRKSEVAKRLTVMESSSTGDGLVVWWGGPATEPTKYASLREGA